MVGRAQIAMLDVVLKLLRDAADPAAQTDLPLSARAKKTLAAAGGLPHVRDAPFASYFQSLGALPAVSSCRCCPNLPHCGAPLYDANCYIHCPHLLTCN